MKEKDFVHKVCGGTLNITLEDNGGCSDPECCGGASYDVRVECTKCGEIFNIY